MENISEDQYARFSAFIEMPKQYNDSISNIIKKVERMLIDEKSCDNDINIQHRITKYIDKDGVWFYDDCEHKNHIYTERIARCIFKELQIESAFCCLWKYNTVIKLIILKKHW